MMNVCTQRRTKFSAPSLVQHNIFSSRSSVYARYQEGLEIDRCGGKHTCKTICLNRIYELYLGFARPIYDLKNERKYRYYNFNNFFNLCRRKKYRIKLFLILIFILHQHFKSVSTKKYY